MNEKYFIKKLFPSNLGKAGMHDKYITVPKKIKPQIFFGAPSKSITCIDKNTGVHYNFPYSLAANGEFRLTQFGTYFNDKKANVYDEILIEKITVEGSIKYLIDLLKNGKPSDYPVFTLQLDEVNEDAAEYYPEGSRESVLVNKYERNTKARKKSIDYHGINCKACGFNFKKKYGQVGEDFIHVHHVVPMADIGQSYHVNPIKDLIPVCPNCHAMIHKKKPPYSIQEIKEFLKRSKEH